MKTQSECAKLAYEKPEADIIRLSPEDVISASGGTTERTEKQYFNF